MAVLEDIFLCWLTWSPKWSKMYLTYVISFVSYTFCDCSKLYKNVNFFEYPFFHFMLDWSTFHCLNNNHFDRPERKFVNWKKGFFSLFFSFLHNLFSYRCKNEVPHPLSSSFNRESIQWWKTRARSFWLFTFVFVPELEEGFNRIREWDRD